MLGSPRTTPRSGAETAQRSTRASNVNPGYGLDQRVRAFAEFCGCASPPSLQFRVGPPPNPLPTPRIDPIYNGADCIRVNTLVNGALHTRPQRIGIGPIGTWSFAHFVDMSPAFAEGEPLEAVQAMCPFNPPSDPGGTSVRPCSAMPAPLVAPIQAGDTSVVVTQWDAGARIKVFQNAAKIGDGGPPKVATAPIAAGAPVYVHQVAGSCRGSTVREINSLCVAPPVAWVRQASTPSRSGSGISTTGR